MIFSTIEAAAGRARSVVLVLAFILVAGLAAYAAIPKESNPDITVANINVSVVHEGISPQDAERLLIRPAEKELTSLEGVKEVKSYANEGSANIRVEFEAGYDSDKALAEVRNKIDEVKPEWPEGTDEPIIIEEDFSLFPILNVLLVGDVPERTLVTVARNLRDKIENLPQVLQADVYGAREDVVEIIVDPLVLESYALSPADVLETVRRNNVIIPAGQLETGKGDYSVKLPGLVETLMDLRNIPVKVNDKTVTTISDVAEIRRTYKSRANFARAGGQNAVGLGVSKRAGANIIETVATIRELVQAESANWPNGIKVIYSQDTSTDIREMLRDLQNNVILAIVLVVVVIIATMGGRAALLVAIAIPGSLLIGILLLYLWGITMNIVVLFSLILSVGMLVDAAIVVSEYADRKMIEGLEPKRAYIIAAQQMAWPVIISTVTTLTVFMPLLFWPDFVGEFMKFMPLTLILVLSGSLLMAMVFIPTLGGLLRPRRVDSEDELQAMLAKENGDFDKLDAFSRGYVHLLAACLRKPWRFVAGMVATIAGIYVVYGLFNAGVEFFPDVEPRNAAVIVRGAPELSIEEKDALVREVEARILPMEEVRVVYARSGKTGYDQDEIGNIQIEFINWEHRRPADAILEDIRAKTLDIAGITVETNKQQGGPPKAADVQIELRSRYGELLDATADAIMQRLRATSGLIEVRDDRSLPEIEWQLNVNRELAGQYGLDISVIGNFIKLVTNGIIASDYRPDDVTDEVDIIVRFPEESRSISQLDRLKIYTPQGLVPIGNFVTRVPKERVGQIRRIDGEQAVNITANVAPGILPNDMVNAIRAELNNTRFDPNVQVRFRGESEDQDKASRFLSTAFLIALFAMTLILITQFNSIYYALIIMSAVFFSTGGVLLGLLLTQQPFGIVMCGVGIISLAGIVVNNNIIFIDTFMQLHRSGTNMRQALLLTGAQRLRPILLTAGTTVLGLLPMVVGMNIDFLTGHITFGAPSSQWWLQLSTSIAGGLAFATILTLFFTPCLLALGQSGIRLLRRHTPVGVN
jgi:multidrug efflux pump